LIEAWLGLVCWRGEELEVDCKVFLLNAQECAREGVVFVW
jgi:hypothetical protein